MNLHRSATTVLTIAALLAGSSGTALAATATHHPGAASPIAGHTGQAKAGVVQGGSTGTGPATQADCEQIAAVIQNRLEDAAYAAHSADGGPRWKESIEAAMRYIDQGESAGCFFVGV